MGQVIIGGDLRLCGLAIRLYSHKSKPGHGSRPGLLERSLGVCMDSHVFTCTRTRRRPSVGPVCRSAVTPTHPWIQDFHSQGDREGKEHVQRRGFDEAIQGQPVRSALIKLRGAAQK